MATGLAHLFDRIGYDVENLSDARILLGLVAIVALSFEASRESEGRPIARRWKRWAGAALAVVGVISFFQFFQVGYFGFYHRWDFFYRYLGARHASELGYERLLHCSVLAESQLPGGLEAVRGRKIRDLRTMGFLETSDVLADPERCLQGFLSPDGSLREAAWARFRGDIAFFRRESPGNYWRDLHKDSGYPSTPIWNLLGHALASLAPTSVPFLQILASIDIALLATLFGCVAWAFGWRVMCVMLVFWGAQGIFTFYWKGGAFLDQAPLFCLMLSACLIRRRAFFWGGFSFACAALGYPLLAPIGLGWLIVVAARLVRKRSLLADHKRLLGGALAAALLLLPASVAAFGARSWVDYAEQSSRLPPVSLTTHMGWNQVVVHHADARMQVIKDPRLNDPFARWKSMRRERLQEHWVVFRGGQAAGLVLLLWACLRLKNLWVVMGLSSMLPFLFFSQNCFEISYFLLLAPLSRGRRPLEIGLLAAAVVSQLVCMRFGWFDDRFAAMSVLVLFLQLFALLLFLPSPRWGWLAALAGRIRRGAHLA